MDDLVVPSRRDALAGSVAAWLVPHRLWEARHRWGQLRSGGCSAKRSLTIALSGRRTNALVNSRLDLLPGHVLDNLVTLVDVGANVGQWTAGVLEVARPRHVRVFEPSPDVFPIVSRRFAARPEVKVVQAAVGDRNGTVSFYVTDHSHNASVLRPREDSDDLLDSGAHVRAEVDVKMVSLDTALADLATIDILKVDVQGFERSVLAGASATLRRTAWVLLEANFVSLYEDDLLLPELHALMLRAGFTLANLSHPYIRKGRALFADALYRCDPETPKV